MKTTSRIFWGIFFILAAAGILLTSLGVLSFGINIFWLVATIFLVAIILRSLVVLEWVGVFLPLAGIVCIYNDQLADLLGVSTGNIWAATWPVAVFLMIGFYILFRPKNRLHRAIEHSMHGHRHCENGEGFDQIINDEDGSEVSISTSFGSVIKYVNSKKLEKASVNVSFGAAKVYFDNAKLSSDGATCTLSISFGAAELYIPSEWRVVDDSSHSLSGVEEKNRSKNTDPKKVLHLVGDISFSGVTIIYI